MTVADVTGMISTVGFPIAACIALYYQNLKTTGAIAELTKAITELKTYIEIQNTGGSDDGK